MRNRSSRAEQMRQRQKNRDFLENRIVRSGVDVHNEREVENVPLEEAARMLIQGAIDDFNRIGEPFYDHKGRRKIREPLPHEITVADENKALELELSLGKASMVYRGGDFITVDTAIAAESNRVTDYAIDRASSYVRTGEIGLALVRRYDNIEEGKRKRMTRIIEEVSRLSVPVISVHIPAPQDLIFKEPSEVPDLHQIDLFKDIDNIPLKVQDLSQF